MEEAALWSLVGRGHAELEEEEVRDYLLTALKTAVQADPRDDTENAEDFTELVASFAEDFANAAKVDVEAVVAAVVSLRESTAPATAVVEAREAEPEPEPEPELELESELQPLPQLAEVVETLPQDEKPEVVFLRDSFPSLSAAEIRGVLMRFGGEVSDRTLEALLRLQASRERQAEAEVLRAARTSDGGPNGVRLGGGGLPQPDPEELSPVAQRLAAKQRKALLERYLNSDAGGSGGRTVRKKNSGGGGGGVKSLGLTRQQQRAQDAAEQAAKTRFLDGEIVTRTGQKMVDVSKKEDPEFVRATSVNLGYKSSKGRRHTGR